LVGQIAFYSDLAKQDIRILKIIRNNGEFIPNRSSRIEANDILLVECSVEDVIKIKETPGLEVLADTINHKEIENEKIIMAELIITPGSRLISQTLKESRFRQNYDLVVLAVQRFGETVSQKIGGMKLKIGDTLLVQGTQEDIDNNRNSNEFSI